MEKGPTGFSREAETVLAVVADRLPEASGHDPHAVLRESGLSGVDFNLALRELQARKVDGYPVVFLSRTTKFIGTNPSAWDLIKKHRDHLVALLKDREER